MSMKKFEERRLQAQKRVDEELAKIAEEEQKERGRRVGPLVSRYAALFEDVVAKALNARVDDLDNARFRKAAARQRIEAFVASELEALILVSDDVEADEGSGESGQTVPEDLAPPTAKSGKDTEGKTKAESEGLFSGKLEDELGAK